MFVPHSKHYAAQDTSLSGISQMGSSERNSNITIHWFFMSMGSLQKALGRFQTPFGEPLISPERPSLNQCVLVVKLVIVLKDYLVLKDSVHRESGS